MNERQEERLHPPLNSWSSESHQACLFGRVVTRVNDVKGALGVAPLFGFLFSERARKEQIGVWGYPPTRSIASLCGVGITKKPLFRKDLREV